MQTPNSPRLPSPPPAAEIQYGFPSPTASNSTIAEEDLEAGITTNSARRIHPGAKASDMAGGPPLVPLTNLESAFQLQEHLKSLHHEYTKSAGEHTRPISRSTARSLVKAVGQDKSELWLYELCRFLIIQCNDLIAGFLFDSPPCSASTCPEMRASEWQFLCAVHETPNSCCAIDYCCHTLDWAVTVVTNPDNFPSRLALRAGSDAINHDNMVKQLTNIFRRLNRIFAHAWFQHRSVFWQVEGQSGLYILFKTVCDAYDLLPTENFQLPPEAEGLPPAATSLSKASILQAPINDGKTTSTEHTSIQGGGRISNRGHIRASPSTGSAVTTVIEVDEDEVDVARRMSVLHIGTDLLGNGLAEREGKDSNEAGRHSEFEAELSQLQDVQSSSAEPTPQLEKSREEALLGVEGEAPISQLERENRVDATKQAEDNISNTKSLSSSSVRAPVAAPLQKSEPNVPIDGTTRESATVAETEALHGTADEHNNVLGV